MPHAPHSELLPVVGSAEGELESAAESAVDQLREKLEQHGRGLASLLTCEVYYSPATMSPSEVTSMLGGLLPVSCRPALAVVPGHDEPGRPPRVTLDAVSTSEQITSYGDGRFPDSVVAGQSVALAAVPGRPGQTRLEQTSEVIDALGQRLRDHSLDFDDVVKFNIFYVGDGTMSDWAVGAELRGRAFHEPGPVATGIPVSRLDAGSEIMMFVLAVRGSREQRTHSWPEGHWDWPIHLPYKHGLRIGRTSWVGGQVSLGQDATTLDPDDMAAQAKRALENIERVLLGLGSSTADIVRLTAHFTAKADNQQILQEALASVVDPTTTEIAYNGQASLAYEKMVVEIEAMAQSNDADTPAS